MDIEGGDEMTPLRDPHSRNKWSLNPRNLGCGDVLAIQHVDSSRGLSGVQEARRADIPTLGLLAYPPSISYSTLGLAILAEMQNCQVV